MYLSRLTLNPRSDIARRDERNAYEMHSTLKRLFTDAQAGAERILFRLEPPSRERPTTVLVQSRTAPNFSALPRGYCVETVTRADYGEKVAKIAPGQRLAFRLLANPTRKVTVTEGDEPRKTRKPLLDRDQQREWLRDKLTAAGTELLEVTIEVRRTMKSQKRGDKANEGEQTHVPVFFEGLLRVTDPAKLRAAIESGIGSAKGYGFGLLSLRPERFNRQSAIRNRLCP